MSNEERIDEEQIDFVAKALARALGAGPEVTAAPWRWEKAAKPYRDAALVALESFRTNGARS